MTTRDAGVATSSATDRDVVIEIRDASVRFEMGRGTANVLDGVSLDIAREETLGIVGESGSGKSMLASALLDAVVEPGQVAGEITYYPSDGPPVDVLDLSDDQLKALRWEEISMIFQGAMSSFNPTMTIGDHFQETVLAHKENLSERMAHANHLLSELHLDPKRVFDAYPHELSGGMKQRALIALSLVLEPDVLVMDEPTAALDLLMQRSILSLLTDLREEYDLTLIFITHDLPLVAGLSDRLAVMYAFQVVELGPVTDVMHDAAHPYTRALLRSVPSLDRPLEDMGHIEGESPDPVNVPEGCPYHPRCPLADERCVEAHPPFQAVSGDHEAACYHWESAADAIPYSLDVGEVGGAGGDR